MEYITQPRRDPGRKDFFDYRKIRDMRNKYFEERGHGKEPEKFHVRSDHFLRLFNDDFNLKGDKAMTRRTLQFYSSPQIKLFPLPTYKDRHTAYYLFPDHFELLGAIWTMRNKLFMPLDMIRAILKIADPDIYTTIIDHDESPEALIDYVMMDKHEEFEPEEFHLYRDSKGILDDAVLFTLRRDYTEEDARQAMLKELDQKYAELKDWISSGKAGKFLSALAEGREKFEDTRERLKKLASEGKEESGEEDAEDED